MISPLDDMKWLYLNRIVFANDTLNVFVVEGIETELEPIEIPVGDEVISMGKGRPIEITNESRIYHIKFERVIAFQRFTESIDTVDPQDTKDDGKLKKITTSSYLSYLEATYSLMGFLYEDRLMYCLCCLDDIVYVICREEPTFELIERTS